MTGGLLIQGENYDALHALNHVDQCQGKVKLDSIRKEQLPKEWQTLDAPALKAEIEKKQKTRAEVFMEFDLHAASRSVAESGREEVEIAFTKIVSSSFSKEPRRQDVSAPTVR